MKNAKLNNNERWYTKTSHRCIYKTNRGYKVMKMINGVKYHRTFTLLREAKQYLASLS